MSVIKVAQLYTVSLITCFKDTVFAFVDEDMPVTVRETFQMGMEFEKAELTSATDNFSRHLVVGSGGFGKVYKAKLRHTVVAIKVLTEVNVP